MQMNSTTRLKISVLVVLSLVAILVVSSRQTQAEVPTSQPAPVHVLRLSLVAEPGDTGSTDSLTDPDHNNQELKVCEEAIVDETSVASVKRSTDLQGHTQISIELTDAAGKAFHTFTSKNIYRKLAIIVEGRIVYCAIIQTTIGKSMTIDRGDGFADGEAYTIVNSIKAAMAQHATTQPAER